jgi:F0F1-type ATP synthase membrane subunit b/b'
MQQRALKTEVNEMLVLLKKYTKNSAFHKTVKEMAENITENETEIEKLQDELRAVKDSITEKITNGLR